VTERRERRLIDLCFFDRLFSARGVRAFSKYEFVPLHSSPEGYCIIPPLPTLEPRQDSKGYSHRGGLPEVNYQGPSEARFQCPTCTAEHVLLRFRFLSHNPTALLLHPHFQRLPTKFPSAFLLDLDLAKSPCRKLCKIRFHFACLICRRVQFHQRSELVCALTSDATAVCIPVSPAGLLCFGVGC